MSYNLHIKFLALDRQIAFILLKTRIKVETPMLEIPTSVTAFPRGEYYPRTYLGQVDRSNLVSLQRLRAVVEEDTAEVVLAVRAGIGCLAWVEQTDKNFR